MVGVGVTAISTSVLTDSRLFLVDGIISIPIALAAFFVLPDLPEITRARYFTQEVCLKL